jgi:hypothetical protein
MALTGGESDLKISARDLSAVRRRHASREDRLSVHYQLNSAHFSMQHAINDWQSNGTPPRPWGGGRELEGTGDT